MFRCVHQHQIYQTSEKPLAAICIVFLYVNVWITQYGLIKSNTDKHLQNSLVPENSPRSQSGGLENPSKPDIKH